MKNNTWVVLQREYTTRVKKKGFLVMTILGPVLLVALMLAPALLMKVGSSVKNYALVDETGVYVHAFDEQKHVFELLPDTATAREGIREGKYEGVLWIQKSGSDSAANHQKMVFLYESEPSMTTVEKITSLAENTLKMELIRKNAEMDSSMYEFINHASVEVISQDIETGERSYTEIKSLMAYIAGFLIYGFIFMFGSQIMAGVIEEKNSRIIEVMISSVKPFQLLMGKVLGLALVGLTQFLLWGLLTLLLVTVVGVLGGGGIDAAQMAAAQASAPGMDPTFGMNELQSRMVEIQEIVQSLHIKTFLIFFLVYFLGGYLLYASMFASVGSAVENQEDTNQLMWPITVPMLIGIIALSMIMHDPNGPLSFWLSIIPFTSPIIMLARIPFGVPTWELVLSIGLLILCFVGTTWMAARIYRVGILMYGKKGSYKELWRWIRYRS